MNPITSTLPNFCPLDALQTNGETDEPGAQLDDFSALLGSLIIPLAGAVQPNVQPLPPETLNLNMDESDACQAQAISSSQTYLFSTPTGFMLDDLVAPSAPESKLGNIFEKLQPREEKLTVEESETLIPNQVSPTVGDYAISNVSETSAQLQTPSSENCLTPIELETETTRMPLDFASWQKQQFFNLYFSPPSSQPASFAAAMHSLHNESVAQPDNQLQIEGVGIKPDAAPVIVEFSQPNISSTGREVPAEGARQDWQALPAKQASPANFDLAFSEQVTATQAQTKTQADTSGGNAQGSLTTEPSPGSSPAKSGKARSLESQFSTEASPTLNSVSSQTSTPESATKVTQSIATQISRTVTQVAGEVLNHREPRSLRIRLRPEELGEVQIHLTTDAEGRLSAQISAEHDLTRQAIAGGLDHLRETLEQAGINIDQLNVNVGHFANTGSGAQAEAGSKQAAGQTSAAAQTQSSLLKDASDDKTSTQEERLLSMRA